jgi:D-alanyl-lipoteichoic acid acyltransferase DltB (MBOAT superfamily)
MLFTSPEFVFVFLPLTFLGFLGLSRVNQPAAIAWLVAASLGFYGYWNLFYLALLLPSIVLNYAAGRVVSSFAGRARYVAAALAITANLAVLAWFKYAGFLATNLNLLGLHLKVPAIMLPLGVSFITFQKIAYIADSYSGKTRDRGFLRFALFVSFFPQLIAGPIAHHSEILDQLEKSVRVRAAEVAAGLSLFSVGLLKKVMIADGVAGLADRGFVAVAQGGHLAFSSAWASAISYSIQLYFDFSGYCDMACGLALIFGIRLPINFFSPYKATSVIEFWRRWHMTLSRFLRDYVYIPLGGNRRGPWRRHINLMATMLLGGLWHGAGWTFVLWGGYHGFLLLINHAWRSLVGGPSGRSPARTAVSTAVTFLAVVVGWVLFRSNTVASAASMLLSLTDIAAATATDAFTPTALEWAKLVAALGCVWLLPNSIQIFLKARPALGEIEPPSPGWLEWRPSVVWAAASALCAAIAMTPTRPTLSFLYFQF